MQAQNRTGQSQIVICRCGNAFAICRAPECYTDRDWQKDVRRYIKGGCTVETLNTKEAVEKYSLGNCTCNKTKASKEQPKEIEKQLELF